MNIDWTKYPPLPEPPELPSWRDTPEREAYFEEYNQIRANIQPGYPHYILAGFLVVCGTAVIKMYEYTDIGLWSMICVISLFLLVMIWEICCNLLLRIKLFKKYHMFPLYLRRPKMAGIVANILQQRPFFNETEFKSYWPTRAHSNMALKIRKWVQKKWRLPDKMLYPNDSVILLYEHIIIDDKEDFGEFFYNVPTEDFFNYDNTFADIVEICITHHCCPVKKSA